MGAGSSNTSSKRLLAWLPGSRSTNVGRTNTSKSLGIPSSTSVGHTSAKERTAAGDSISSLIERSTAANSGELDNIRA